MKIHVPVDASAVALAPLAHLQALVLSLLLLHVQASMPTLFVQGPKR